MNLRRANIKDANDIYKLISYFAKKGLLLQRTLSNIYDNIRDFNVIEVDNEIVAIAAMHVCWEDFGEIRSICVKEEHFFKGYGRALVEASVRDAVDVKLSKLFVLTYQVEFFEKLGFFLVNKKVLPKKIWGECINCPKFPNCDETAMMKIL
jgi:amino-acid N-acetyltransferase